MLMNMLPFLSASDATYRENGDVHHDDREESVEQVTISYAPSGFYLPERRLTETLAPTTRLRRSGGQTLERRGIGKDRQGHASRETATQ